MHFLAAGGHTVTHFGWNFGRLVVGLRLGRQQAGSDCSRWPCFALSLTLGHLAKQIFYLD
jgi:hypothetical protein